MVIYYWKHSAPLVMPGTVVDDFGDIVQLGDLPPSEWGYSDAQDAAFDFAADGGACPGAHEGALH